MSHSSVPSHGIPIIFLVLIGLALITTTPLFAQVYKHVDEKGNVTYSDVPQKKGDKPISLPKPSTYEPESAPNVSAGTEGQNTQAPKTIEYESVTISAPANESTIRSNEGNISVQFTSNPGLQGSNVYVVLLDGSKIQESTANSVTLNNIDRGSHTITVQIQDDNAQILATSEPVTVHLFRHSIAR